ncbi:MAG: calcium-binding protein [Tepidisphaeraceae bacterium]
MYLGNRILTSSARRRARIASAGALRGAVDNALEPLELRRLYAVTATSAGGVLTVLGDNNANAITVSRNANGNLLVNNGTVPILGSPATVSNILSIHVSGLDGNDRLTLDETNGALPKASLSGGSGNDTLTSGAGADTLDGGSGNDLLLGKGGNDSLVGGSGNDTLTGGAGTDSAFGQSGDDRMVWNPGDGSDLNEGGDGTDTVEVNGGDVAESFSVLGVGDRILFQRIDPGPFTIDIGGSERLVLNAKGGDDSFFGGNGLAALTSFIDGGTGDDSLLGTDGADTLLGGDGNDFVDGNAGIDVGLLGAGDDVFRWDGGDGSDVVEGGSGADLMIFNGANASERADLSARNGRLRFFRDLGSIIMDVNDTEAILFNALGGADSVTIHNLQGTDVREVNVDLQASAGTVDGADEVIVEGSEGGDVIIVGGSAGGVVAVSGLAAAVNISGAEPTDTLNVKARGGRDVVIASALNANAIRFVADGGRGDDFLIGGAGNDTLFGGDGADVLIGGPGNDFLDGGAGDDIKIQ